jgi:DNA-binding NarL/FixJ family response regulator
VLAGTELPSVVPAPCCPRDPVAALLRVLIVDDALAFATLIAHWLRGCPQIELIGTARSGAEAIEQVERLRPDVVVLDHLLHDVPAGSEALAPQLRAMHPDVGIVLISAMPQDRLEGIAGRCGADTYLSKGSGADRLCEAILAVGRRLEAVPA